MIPEREEHNGGVMGLRGRLHRHYRPVREQAGEGTQNGAAPMSVFHSAFWPSQTTSGPFRSKASSFPALPTTPLCFPPPVLQTTGHGRDVCMFYVASMHVQCTLCAYSAHDLRTFFA